MTRETAPNASTIPGKTSKAQRKRMLILEAATRHFARHGYDAARVGDIAAELGIAKGSIFQHFSSKDGLFVEVYKEAIQSLPGYMDAPENVANQGIFEIARHWLASAERLREQHKTAYQIVLIGNHGSELKVKKSINRFLAKEDPLGVSQFVRAGIERGDLRTDIDERLLAAILDWNLCHFRDLLLMPDGNTDFFPEPAKPNHISQQEQIEQFLKLLRSAVGREGRA